MRGSRLPLAINGGVALLMLGLIGLFGFQAAVAPPPTVAALQPPSRQLKQAPPEQAVVNLSGQRLPSPSPSPAPPPGAGSAGPAGASRQCYQLTQTPDPQSPPCRQGWDPTRQDNGGATAQGVTRDKIYVAYPCDAGLFERCLDSKYLAQFFNTHFEFWGRQLVLLDPYCSTWDSSGGCAPPPGSDNKLADLQKDASTAAHANDGGGGVFASLSYFPLQGNEHYFYDALASQYRVVSVSSVPNSQTEGHYQQYHPYEWSVTPSLDLTEQNLGQFLCRTMARRAPAWAQSTVQFTQPAQRSFGILWSRNPDGSNPDLAPLIDILQGCTTSGTLHVLQYDGTQNGAATSVAQLTQDHVSTVACVCANSYTVTLANAADNQGYHPEWIAWPFGFHDTDTTYWQYVTASGGGTSQWPADQQNQVIGFSDFNKILPPDEEFWFQAIREGDPAYQYGDNGSDIYDYYRYEELMVLATGIQMAGPHLTPASFAAALEQYPARDPGHGAAPYYQGLVGFTAGHGWIQDYAPVYWNSNAQNYYTNEPRQGSLCYIADGGGGLGVRFGLNTWPDHQLAFYPGGNAPCR